MKNIVKNIIGFSILAAASAQLGVWSFDRKPSYEVFDGTTSVDKVTPGSEMEITWGKIIVHNDSSSCHGTYQREVIDCKGGLWQFVKVDSTFHYLGVGVHTNVHSTLPWRIPLSVAKCEAQAYSKIETWCNPIQWLFPVKSQSQTVKIMVE